MTDGVASVGTHKPARDEDRKTIHSAGNEVSTESPSFTSIAATLYTSTRSTSFFDVLPRELRHAVYDYTFEHVDRRRSDTGNDVLFHFHGPISNLRLVSRQFTTEYDERYKTISLNHSLLTIANNSRNSRRSWHLEYPRLATRCTELKTVRSFFDGCEEYTMLAHRHLLYKVLMHFHQTTALIQRLPHLDRVDMCFNFESLHHSGYHEDLVRLFSRLALFRSWPAEGRYELRYQGLTYPEPAKLRELGVLDIAILDAPVTLAAWNQASQTELIDSRELEQLLCVEAAVLEAWQTKYGCSLWGSKRLLRETE